MNKHEKLAGVRLLFALSFATVLTLLAPRVTDAQVTIKHVKVTVSPASGATTGLVTAVYCDYGTLCPGGTQVWDLGTGVTLLGGQTLVLAQTGLVPAGSNFDTSDRVLSSTPLTTPCQNPNSPCQVSIDLDTGSGLSNVFTTSAGNPINNNNGDTGGGAHQEQAQWTAPVFSAPNYTLQLGYADNVHGCTAPDTGTTTCFPNPFDGSDGTTPVTFFIGDGVSISSTPSCGNNCYDGGALLITGIGFRAVCMAQTMGQLGVPYSSFIGASGGNPPYMFSVNSGSLPPALMLQPVTGEISGTPTTAGIFNFTVEVTDSSRPVQTAITDECSINIFPRDLFIHKDGPSSVAVGDVFDFTILVQNYGKSPQLGVKVVDQLPADGKLISSQPPGFLSQDGLNIPIGNLSPGASVMVTVTWQAPQREVTLVNSASVYSTSSSAGPSMAEVSVKKVVIVGKLDDVFAIAGGTGLRNRKGNMMNGKKVDGIIKIPAVPAGASFDKVQQAFLVWTVLFQGDLKDVSNKITFERQVVEGINATPPRNPKDKPEDWKLWSGPLCWPDFTRKFDDATVGFVADVTKIMEDKKLDKDTTYIVSDPVNAINFDMIKLPKPGDIPTPVYPVTDGASLIIFYTIKGQPKTQVLYDFTYDSNSQKDVSRKFTGVDLAKTPSDLILAGPDGQSNLSDRTQFIGKSTVTLPNLWNGKDDLQYGKFPGGNLWDTIQGKRPKVLEQDKKGQTFEVKLVRWNTTASDLDCVGISAVVLVTPQ